MADELSEAADLRRRLEGEVLDGHRLGGFGNVTANPRAPGARADPRARETETASSWRGDGRLDVVPRADAQRRLDRDEIEPHAAATARVGVPEGDELFVTGGCRRAAHVHSPRARRGS